MYLSVTLSIGASSRVLGVFPRMTLFSRVLLCSSVVLIMSGMLRDVISIGSFGVREMGGGGRKILLAEQKSSLGVVNTDFKTNSLIFLFCLEKPLGDAKSCSKRPDEADQRRRFLQFDVQEFCHDLEKEMLKTLMDVSKIQKKSTTTHAPVAESSIFISEEPKGKSKNNLEDFSDFSDSLPICDEYDEELIESLINCEEESDLLSPKSDFMFDDEETNGLTCFEPEHPSSLVLFSQDFEEEPFDYSHQGPLLGTRKPMDDDVGPIFDEEDEPGPTFEAEAPSVTSIIMENQLCFDPVTTPTPLSTNIQEHCEKLDLINYLFRWTCAWAAIAAQLPGRTDNEIKNLWNTHLKKRMLSMGLDPKTHEPLPSHGLAKQAPASQTTRHMAQWESARLEAEARLSRESMLFNPSCEVKYECDHFLRIWNSEIGETFKNLTTTSQSPCSRTTSSSSALVGKETVMGINHGSGSSSPCSNNVEDVSSDSALQLLLDFPISDDDMCFLEENIGSSYTESHVGVSINGF
ncbi:hypothetical protein F2Q70_00044208 [Brassica cretica]|uniref:HTH myb-type domain-containing protein n=1 Tax=Brassica cretica TaxID=69181 RepID=A0A8S9KFV8_BRACR|nr:hypothetical protein F2Q70_00044208 [Brassica cretica]